MSPAATIGVILATAIVPQTDDFVQVVECEKLEMNQGLNGRGLQYILWDYHDQLGYTISWWAWDTASPKAQRFSPFSKNPGYGLIWADDGVLRIIKARRVEWTYTQEDPEVEEQRFDGRDSSSRGLWNDWEGD